MHKYRVLHVEHDTTYAEDVEYQLKSNNFDIHTVDDPEKIDELITEINFDVVLTDVKWPENENDDLEKKERLGEVIEHVRKHNSLVPIIALSRKEESHKVVLEYKDEIYDIWAKTSGYPKFLIYRLKNLIKSQQNRLAEEHLLKETIKIIEENSDAWEAEEVKKMCYDILKFQGLGFILKRIGAFYEEISFKVGLEEEFLESIFGTFLQAEPIDLARNSKSWGHLRHSLSVFLSGYILLNELEGLLDIEKIADDMNVSGAQELNSIWFIASAYHDTATYYQHIPEILGFLKNLCPVDRRSELLCQSDGEELSIASLDKFHLKYKAEDINALRNIIKESQKTDALPNIEDYYNKSIDHGIIAAANLYENSCDKFESGDVLSKASYIIMMHNCFTKIKDIYKEADDILLQLFCIIDNLQAWGRENQYEGILNCNHFSSVVLRKFIREINSENGEKKLRLKIDYIPFKTSSPNDSIHQENERDLKRVLRRIIDKLKKVGVKNNNGELFWNKIKLDITFCINGRKLTVFERST